MTSSPDFARFVDALNRHAARLARARAVERRAGDAKWRSPRLLWPQSTGEQ